MFTAGLVETAWIRSKTERLCVENKTACDVTVDYAVPTITMSCSYQLQRQTYLQHFSKQLHKIVNKEITEINHNALKKSITM